MVQISVNFRRGETGALLVAEDGEILVKGENVMLGYWNKKEETEKVLKDGWLYTGDIGEIDPQDGYLKITDRKKDIIVSAGGDNISPAKIENQLTNSPAIEQSMVYGEGKTHFYGIGVADPLRKDISLRSLEAKTARFECFASLVGSNVYNLSKEKESRLVYRRKNISSLSTVYTDRPRKIKTGKMQQALKFEKKLNYFIADGKYWKHEDTFDKEEIDNLDKLWLQCLGN